MEEVIQLTEDLLTGVPEMDEQHRVLVNLMNETYALLRQGNREGAKEKLLSGVVAYVEYHLESEQAFLQKVGYPEYDAHRKIHESFRNQMYEWVEEAKTGNENAIREVVAMIWAWFFRHIAVKDKAYGAFCVSRSQGQG